MNFDDLSNALDDLVVEPFEVEDFSNQSLPFVGSASCSDLDGYSSWGTYESTEIDSSRESSEG